MPFQSTLITQKSTWEEFIASHPEANFLSSWNWGQFHTKLGKTVTYLGFFQNQVLVGVALLVKETAKRGNYLTLAGGPILDWDNTALVKFVFQTLRSQTKLHQAAFLRFRPQILNTSKNCHLLTSLNTRPSPMHLTADLTLQLDLTQSTDHLLSQMKKNTRYEIRRIQKLGITTRISTDSKEIKTFYHHQLALAKKHGFVPFSYPFLYHQFQCFVADNQVVLIHAYQNQHLLASAFIILYGQEAVYHYGISTPQNQKLPGSYACQWQAIQLAKQKGLTRYNFWGIAPATAPADHRFAGVSLFKRGFGGQEVDYLPAHDLVVSPTYYLTFAFEKLRAKLRHLS